MFGEPALRDRDEEELRGYRDALKLQNGGERVVPLKEGNKEGNNPNDMTERIS
jgi:hypothetical protein